MNYIVKSNFTDEKALIVRKLRKVILIVLISSSIGFSFLYFVLGRLVVVPQLSTYFHLNWIEYDYSLMINLTDLFSVLLGITTSIIFSLVIYRIIRKKRLELLSQAHKFKNLLQGKEKVEIEELGEYFKYDTKTFYTRVIEWGEKFNLTIDGDYLLMDKEMLQDFIENLDKQYQKWGKIEQKKIDKID